MLRSIYSPAAALMRAAHTASTASMLARPAAAACAAASSGSAVAALCASPFSFTPARGLVVDRATRRVGRTRRLRREMLRKLAFRQRGSENESRRMATQEPPLAGMDASAANLHQFVAFMARQAAERAKGVASKEAESLRIARAAAAPAWSLTFADLSELMKLPNNRTFRACEEILSVLSDPTTELGLSGLSDTELATTLNYVNKTMRAVTTRLVPELHLVGEFQHMSADDQYELAGAYAVRFLAANIAKDKAAADKILLEARANKILVPGNTPLGKAMHIEGHTL